MPFHVLKYEKRLAGFRDARVEPPWNIRVRKTGQQRSLAFESFLARAIEDRKVQELDCRVPFEQPVAAAREAHRAHAARADRTFEVYPPIR